jgi:hypothetical protein
VFSARFVEHIILSLRSCGLHVTEDVLNRCTVVAEPDPVIVWPNAEPRLSTIIADLQRLNPALRLRYAVEHRQLHDETYLIIDAAGNKLRETTKRVATSSEFLVHHGRGLDVLQLCMPLPVTDTLFHAVCSANSGYLQPTTDLGVFNTGPRRIDRVVPEELQFRPQSKFVEEALIAFSDASRFPADKRDMLVDGFQIKGPWGFYVEGQIWTVDFACLPRGHQLDEDGRLKKYPEWLRTPLLGTISYIDRHDLPFEEHLMRARMMLADGCSFAIVADIERGEVHIYQMSHTIVSEAVRLAHLSWFDIPIGRRT